MMDVIRIVLLVTALYGSARALNDPVQDITIDTSELIKEIAADGKIEPIVKGITADVKEPVVDEVIISDFEYDPTCTLTLALGGVKISNGAEVRAYLGEDIDLTCTAFCTGAGVTPALQWRKNGKKVSRNVGRVYHFTTTSERRSVLHIGGMMDGDLAKYRCKGWIKGVGWKTKWFNLIRGCAPGFEECDTHKCYNSTKVCDGVFDCEDGTDEKHCINCTSEEFECDGECKPNSNLCDVIQHCTDGKDEENCVYNCTAEEFMCDDGECVDLSYRCDQYTDCSDNSDEFNCDACPVGQFACTDGECMANYLKCDDYPDCMDFSDEYNCDNFTEEVAENNCTDGFRCPDGECQPMEFRCDGYEDCSDGSDEDDTCKEKTCQDGETSCDNGQVCFSDDQKCDHSSECADGTDEIGCFVMS